MVVLEGNEDILEARRRRLRRVEPLFMRGDDSGPPKVGLTQATAEAPLTDEASPFSIPSTGTGFGLAEFMAAIRRLESGSYAGNYSAIGRRVKGDNARGAYQIMSKNWPSWSAAAGIPGANWRSKAAQDRVAAHMMNRLYEEFGDWDLVAVAWYSGGSNARKLKNRGWVGNAGHIQNKHIRGYVNKIRGFYPEAQQFASAASGRSPQKFYATNNSRNTGGMLFPLPGSEGKWSDTYGADRDGGARKHRGADIGGKHGAPLVAVTDGRAFSGYNKTAGNFVYLTDSGGNMRYFYAHLDKRYVPVGSSNGVRVSAGQQIGTVGATGNARGPHLHFGVYDLRRGGYTNPTSWLNAARKGGGAYAPPMAQRTMADPMGVQSDQVSYEGMMKTFFESFGNSVAGGERADHRLMGIEEIAEEESAAEQLLGGAERTAGLQTQTGVGAPLPLTGETETLSMGDNKEGI